MVNEMTDIGMECLRGSQLFQMEQAERGSIEVIPGYYIKKCSLAG